MINISYFKILNVVIKMKRLIVIIKILLFSIVGFGHPSGGLISNFHERSINEFSYNTLMSPQTIKTIIDYHDTTITNQNCILTYQVFTKYLNTCSIFNNEKFFMLSYEEDNGSSCYDPVLKLFYLISIREHGML